SELVIKKNRLKDHAHSTRSLFDECRIGIFDPRVKSRQTCPGRTGRRAENLDTGNSPGRTGEVNGIGSRLKRRGIAACRVAVHVKKLKPWNSAEEDRSIVARCP